MNVSKIYDQQLIAKQFTNACKKGDLETVKTLMSKHMWGHLTDHTVNSALTYACNNKHLDIVKHIYSQDGIKSNILISAENENRFIKACSSNYTELVHYMSYFVSKRTLTKGLDRACARGKYDIVEYILGGDLAHKVIANDSMAFEGAGADGNVKVMDYLLKNPIMKTKYKLQETIISAFHSACYNNKTKVVAYMLNEKIINNLDDNTLVILLNNIGKMSSPKMCKLLLEGKETVHHFEFKFGMMENACADGNVPVIKYLYDYMQRTQSYNTIDECLLESMVSAISNKNKKSIECLIVDCDMPFKRDVEKSLQCMNGLGIEQYAQLALQMFNNRELYKSLNQHLPIQETTQHRVKI